MICFLFLLVNIFFASANEITVSKDLLVTPRTPLYLGIFAQNPNKTQNKILKFILEELQFFPDSQHLFTETPLDLFSNEYTFPTTFHITTLYIGNNKSKLETENYQTFVENQKFVIKLDAIVIVPDKIITGITFPDRERILIENKFPHVTLMTKDWTAVDSNDVMTALFDNNGPLNQYYSIDFFESSQPFFEKFKMEIKGENVEVYVIKSAPILKLKALTKKIYEQIKNKIE